MEQASISEPCSPAARTSAVDELQSLIGSQGVTRDCPSVLSATESRLACQVNKPRFVAFAGTLALGLAVACWMAHGPSNAIVGFMESGRNDVVGFVLATHALPNASSAAKTCAAPGKDCKDAPSKCCSTPGYQCFEKNAGWASCRPWCVVGPDPSDKDVGQWSCKALGPKAAGVAPPPDYTVKAAAWVAERCSDAGEDCNKTKCCKGSGMQCFKKADGWSSCKADCVAGPDPTDGDNHHWDCSSIGMRTPGPPNFYAKAAPWVSKKCSAVGENCMHTGCCKDAGMQCFKKHDTWAMCLDHCTKGPMLTDADSGIWSCKALGGRTPGMPQVQPKDVHIAPWVKTKCAKAGEDCSKSMCCSEATQQCFRKSKGWAACRSGCNPGHPQPDDKSGGKWDCATLGIRTPRPWGHPSLYCFSVIMISTYEADIMRQTISHNGGIGIFGCEQYDVFSSEGNVWLGDGPLGAVRTRHFDPAPVTKSVDGTAGNTALFMNVWEAVKWVGRYKLTDWTIKADPDAVIFADRLRGHLAPVGGAAYIVNCNKPDIMASLGPMMFGSLEAVSKLGLQNYFNNEGPCKTGYQYGEDRWLGNCLNSVGTRGAQDFGIVGDQVCTKPPGSPCTDNKPAYHMYKSVGAWMACYNQAVR